jgi:hypothetical protein
MTLIFGWRATYMNKMIFEVKIDASDFEAEGIDFFDMKAIILECLSSRFMPHEIEIKRAYYDVQ